MRPTSSRNELFPRARMWLIALFLVAFPLMSVAETFVSVAIAPPALPVYVQPACPGPGYLWTPGYWAYGPFGYYWVPGTWVFPPSVGLLWTPGYWGWSGGAYLWHGGYWGPRVGYYGGVNYGFGYVGTGYHGGYWRNGAFYYNRAVNNVNVTGIHTTYNATVNTTTINRVSYNGGPGGVRAEPTAVERQAMSERHVEATQMQMQHQNAAAENRAMFASENHGRPAIAATPQPGAFNQPGVTAASESPARRRRPAPRREAPRRRRGHGARQRPTRRRQRTLPSGSQPKNQRSKNSVDGSQSLSTQGRSQGAGARNQANVQAGAQGATASQDKAHRQASGAMSPQEANAAGARAQGGQPAQHPQGAAQGAPRCRGEVIRRKRARRASPTAKGSVTERFDRRAAALRRRRRQHSPGPLLPDPDVKRPADRLRRPRFLLSDAPLRSASRTRHRAGRRHRAPTPGSASRASPTS